MIILTVSCGVKRYPDFVQSQKYEVRAAWIPTVWRNDYKRLNQSALEHLLSQRLEALHEVGINTVVFQVRSEGDAFYLSRLVPVSQFLSGVQGQVVEYYDPLPFIIKRCHQLGMELHAWINPYRAAVNRHSLSAQNHVRSVHPDWIIDYGKACYLNPSRPEVRDHLCRVVSELLINYDLDGVHIDDYFYPYPIDGEVFGDVNDYDRYVQSCSSEPMSLGDWRRHQVDLLIEQLHKTIETTKPWVSLGISPFGIYRNKKSDRKGSDTDGLEGYSALYADVVKWAEEGWIDYVTPQLYWNFGHKVADYGVLVQWWRRHLPKNVHYIVGQHVKRTMDSGQLDRKLASSRVEADGCCYWPAEDLWDNYRSVSDALLRKQYVQRALTPLKRADYKLKCRKVPKKSIRVMRLHGQTLLVWDDMYERDNPETPRFYAVYASMNAKPSVKSAEDLVQVSAQNSFVIDPNCFKHGKRLYIAITAIDHFGNESKPVYHKIKPFN